MPFNTTLVWSPEGQRAWDRSAIEGDVRGDAARDAAFGSAVQCIQAYARDHFSQAAPATPPLLNFGHGEIQWWQDSKLRVEPVSFSFLATDWVAGVGMIATIQDFRL